MNVSLRRALLCAAFVSASAAASAAPPGVIRRFEILSTTPAYGGATPPGAAGPYDVITGIAHGELDPANRLNRGIVDLDHAPRLADGMVAYSTDVVLLRPHNPADAKRVLFYDVVNRGNKLAIPVFIGGGALTAASPPPAGFPSLLAQGVTIVWSGWQGDVKQTGNPSIAATGAIGTDFPTATQKNGKPITGLSREEYIPDYAGGAADTIVLSYPPANLKDHAGVSFTARQSWMTGYGRPNSGEASYTAPSVPVTQWHYATDASGATTVVFTPPAKVPGPAGAAVPADAGTIYSFVYRARDPRVNGIAFAAIRDLVSFLRHDATDASGQPNPLADLKSAACATAACATAREGNFDVAIGEGISQSGRLLKDFLYQGFNVDGQGRPVFEGMLPIISGGRRAWVNERFSQPGRWSKQHEDHWQPGDQFPFSYATLTDPGTGHRGSLLQACTASHTCPDILQLDGEFEWWGARASLVVTDGRGHDVTLPDNVRYYLVPGTQHGGGAGVTTGLAPMPPQGSLCQLPGSPVAEAPVDRALVPALIDWVTKGTAPPASQYPTVAAGTLVAPGATGFPDLHDAMVPSGGETVKLGLTGTGFVNQIFLTTYAKALPVVHHDKPYTVLVPKVGATGNAVAGVLVPDVAVPLASYTGWNPRGAGHAVGDGCTSNGAAIALPISAGAHDPRPSLQALYKGRADYQAKVAAAAEALVKSRYLLPQDATLFTTHAKQVSPRLIPNE